MSERFYVNCSLAPGLVVIQGPEAHHMVSVCRLRPDDQVCLFNGDGRQYPARITTATSKSVTLDVESIEEPARELPGSLELAVTLPKGDRAQFLVEKLTELGVSRLIPLRTQRSIVHPRDSKWEKLQRWVIEASKQCGRNVLMEIAPLADWGRLCRETDPAKLRIMAHPQGEAGANLPPLNGQSMILAVGPEGGFTEEEVTQASAAGWQVVNLGPRILRVETAALALAAWVAIPQSE